MARLPVPGPVVVPGVVQVKVEWANSAGTSSNILHGYHGGTTAINETLAETLLTSFKSSMTSSGWAAIMHPSWSLFRVGVKDISAPFLPEFLSSGAALGGSGVTTPLGDHSAIVFTKQTGKSGAQWRGRTYLGGLDAAATTDGRTATQAAVDAAGAFGEGIRNALQGAGVPMCIAQVALQAGQSSSGADLPPRAANYVPVTRCVVSDNRLDTQRRRLGR